jgi:hypothetical protein
MQKSSNRPSTGYVLRVAGACEPWLVSASLAFAALQTAPAFDAASCRGTWGRFALSLAGSVPLYAADAEGVLVAAPLPHGQWQALCGYVQVEHFRANPNVSAALLTFNAVDRFALRPPRPDADGADNLFYWPVAPLSTSRGLFFETADRVVSVRLLGDSRELLSLARKSSSGVADGSTVVASYTVVSLSK